VANGSKNKTMKTISLLLCWIITLSMLIFTNNTVKEFNHIIKNVEDNSQTILIESLQLELMEVGSRLDSMYLKYD
tara:strand:+ start:1240 stop:1464 length:225 start_codon:yes stop_codon:yes gene_type:complete